MAQQHISKGVRPLLFRWLSRGQSFISLIRYWNSIRYWPLVVLLSSIYLALGSSTAVYLWWFVRPPSAIPREQCSQSRETTPPVQGWRFHLDPQDRGITAQPPWFSADLDDSGWDHSSPGKAWEEQGYPGYDGVAWYRATFSPPPEWGKAYLGIGTVDDSAQLWIDGQKSDWDPAQGPGSQIVELPAGRPVQLTIRIEDRGGAGGIKQAVYVGREPQDALPPDAYLRWLAARNPNWLVGGWARSGHYAWTFTGLPGQDQESLQASDGSIAPWPAAPNVALMLYDPASGQLLAPQPSFGLLDGALPIPQSRWEAAGLTGETILFRSFGDDAVHWQITLRNDGGSPVDVSLLAAVRPIATNSGTRLIHAAGFDRQARLWINGTPFMEASQPPGQVGAGSFVEVLQMATLGQVPANREVNCAPAGDAAAVSLFPLHLESGQTTQIAFGFPGDEGRAFPGAGSLGHLDETRQMWRSLLSAPHLAVPDERILKGYQASLGYLLLALDRDGPRPGPLEHDKVWVRDTAFIGEALLSAGQGDRVLAYLPYVFTYQEAGGKVPPIIGPDGPEPEDEWDSQGQAIFLVAELYRYYRDERLLRQWEPATRRAAGFLRDLRARTANGPPVTRGLLPPSRSAEDLGPPGWHHYWDNFWGVAGLEEAAFIEAELGNHEQADWMRAEAAVLRQAIRSSVEAAMGPEPAYIPGAPEGLDTSAMARGTSVSLYPVEVFSRGDPLVRRSFEYYYKELIEPEKGGYKHIFGQYWPYGALGLARDYNRLGRADIAHQILGWVLEHQTLPGTYAWAEQVSPETGGISGGDMPHAWAAASYITLLREMLVVRHGDRLELFTGVVPSWLERGKTVGVRDIPTEFGTLTALAESDLDTKIVPWKGSLAIHISGSARPAGGFVWRLPHPPSSVAGPPGTHVREDALYIPSQGGTITIRFD